MKPEEASRRIFWLEFLRAENPFPRDIGFYERVKVSNASEYFRLVEENNGKKNIAVAVYSDEQITNRVFDTIFLDFDGGELGESLNIVRGVQSVYGGRMFFSGAKGFHLYLDMEPVRLSNPREALREWVEENISAPNLDVQVVGDVKRIARLPYTVHIKTGLYCVPVLDEPLSIVLDRAKSGEIVLSGDFKRNGRISRELEEIDRAIEEEKQRRAVSVNNSNVQNIDEAGIPFCIRRFLRELREKGELDHYKRFQVAVFFLRLGWSEEAVEKIFTVAKDYDANKTGYQIKYFEKRDMKAYGCEKARAMGLCGLEEPDVCPYYPSMNKVLKILNGGV